MEKTQERPVQLSLFDYSPPPAREKTRTPKKTKPTPSSRRSDTLPITPSTSLHAAITAYSAYLDERDLADASRSAMRSDMNVAGRILGMHRPIEDLSRGTLHHELVRAMHQQYSEATVARRVATVNGFIHWLAEQGAANLPSIPTPKVDKDLPTVLSRGQVRRLLEVTKTDQDARPAFLVRLLLTTAMKKHEVADLRVGNMRLDADPPYVEVKGEDHQRRNITVTPKLRPYYEAYKEQYGPLLDEVFPVTSRALRYDMEHLSEALNAPVNFTSLRWTTALRDLQAGMKLDQLRRKMGLSVSTWEETLERLQRVAV
jgi:site-specific recombinase XerD